MINFAALFKARISPNMKVNVNKVDALNALLTINIEESDYQDKVENTLKDYRKKANIPGFRPGKVPAGLIRKQFGKSVLVEEINNILQRSVYEEIQKEELDILGSPMPVEQNDIDWDNGKEFTFEYELGLAPEFELKINARTKVPYYKVVADAEMIGRYVDDYARRFGKMSSPESVEEHTTFKADFTEVDQDGNLVEEGLKAEASMSVDALKDESLDKVKGKKVGENFILNTTDFKDDFRLSGVLGVDAEQLEASTGSFQIELKELTKIEPAELNQELFDKVFGEGTINSEEEFRQRIKEDAEKVFVGDTDRQFYQDVKSKILEKLDFELPETFLKKWMRTAGEKPMSEEEVEEQFPQIKDDMRWQLVESKAIKDNDIKVEHEELVEYTKALVAQQMAQYGQFPESIDLDKIAHNVLGNKEEAQRINDQLFQQKLITLFKEKLKLEEKEVSYDEFVKVVYGQS